MADVIGIAYLHACSQSVKKETQRQTRQDKTDKTRQTRRHRDRQTGIKNWIVSKVCGMADVIGIAWIVSKVCGMADVIGIA